MFSRKSSTSNRFIRVIVGKIVQFRLWYLQTERLWIHQGPAMNLQFRLLLTGPCRVIFQSPETALKKLHEKQVEDEKTFIDDASFPRGKISFLDRFSETLPDAHSVLMSFGIIWYFPPPQFITDIRFPLRAYVRDWMTLESNIKRC